MSIQLQSISTVLSVSPGKTELPTAIKNEPLESEIGIDDIPNSLDEDIITDIKDIDIVSHVLSEDLIKSETVSENIFENNHSGSVETQVFVKTEHIPLIKTENITQSEYIYKTQDISDKQYKKSYCCEKCTFISENHSNFKRHKLSHKTKVEVDSRYLKYHCDKCKYKTCRSDNFKMHKLIHLKPEQIPYFYCYHCSYKNKRKGHLKIHIFNHFKKEEVPFHCYICDFTTLNRNLIIEHFKKHAKHHSKCDETDYKNQFETYIKYRCDKCKFKTCWLSGFRVHKLKHLKPKQILYFYCYHCSYKCKVKSNLKIHIFNHFKKQEVPFHCYICDFTTLKRDLIIEHFKKHPKHYRKCDETDYKNQVETYTKYRCDKCKYKTYMCSSLKAHKLKHLKPEQIPYFYCYHCPYKCKFKSNLKIHIFNHFKKQEVSFYCYICDFTTRKRNLIIKHFKKHPKHHSKCDETDYKNQFETYIKYRCDKCKFKTCWLSGFKAHKLKHLKPKQILYFYCYHCSYKCKVKSNLKIHIFNHFKKQEVPFHYICDFTTLKRNLIIKHFKKHPKHHSKCDKTDYETYTKKQMRYCCEKCTYTSGKSSAFKLHQLTHKAKAETDDRFLKYRCEKCEYKTCWATTFKAHKLTHLKPEEIHYFHCYHCSYKCKQKINLQTHIVSHFKNEVVPFHCYLCDFVTLKRDLMFKHFKTHPKHHSKCDETDYKNQLEYRCDKCKYKSCWLTNFKRHKLTHLKPEEIQYFYCYHCSYKAKLKAPLKEHIFKHFKNEEIKFHCYICDFVTRKRDLIIEHIRKHFKNRNKYDETINKYQLESRINNLKKRFSNKLEDHCSTIHFDGHVNYIKKQKSEQPESTKSFVSRTESLPENSSKSCIFQCTYCPTKFPKDHLLKGHLQLHSSTKGIECPICTYRHNKTEILKHLSWHGANGNDSFKCPICDVKKRTKENMDDHLKVVHSKDIYQKHDSVCKNKTCNGFCQITIGGNVGAE